MPALLREVVIAPGRSYFDTNTGHHHHFFVEPDGELYDFPSDKVTIAGLPTPPKGTRLSRVDVIVRVRRLASLAARSFAVLELF